MRHAIICTRQQPYKPITEKLLAYLYSANVNVKVMVNQDSIFNGYQKGLEELKPDFNDDVILCHDDIEILCSLEQFNKCLNVLNKPNVGIIGVAGTTVLKEHGMWWDGLQQHPHYHLLGTVWHGDNSLRAPPTTFGGYGAAVVMDGLFLAAKAGKLHKIGLDKPSWAVSDWDFYDINLTFKSFLLGLINVVVPIHVMHNSPGDGASKEPWKLSREAFCTHYRSKLPAKV